MERTVKILEKPISFWLVVTLTLILFITILAIKEYKKQKTVYIAFGSLWFLGMLIPVSGIIPVNGLIYEHWLYVPIIGICITLYGIKKLLTPKHLHKKINEIVKGILFFIIVIYIALTIRQNYLWANPIRFYNYTLQFSESARLRNNLAISYADVEDYKNAIQQYNRAIEVGDFYAQTHHNLANTYLAVGETELAKKEFAIAVRINEKFYPSYLSLINLFIKEKEYKNVLPLIDKLIESSPNNTNYKHLKEQILLKIENSTKLYK